MDVQSNFYFASSLFGTNLKSCTVQIIYTSTYTQKFEPDIMERAGQHHLEGAKNFARLLLYSMRVDMFADNSAIVPLLMDKDTDHRPVVSDFSIMV